MVLLRIENRLEGIVELECRNQREYDVWTQGVSRLLSITADEPCILDDLVVYSVSAIVGDHPLSPKNDEIHLPSHKPSPHHTQITYPVSINTPMVEPRSKDTVASPLFDDDLSYVGRHKADVHPSEQDEAYRVRGVIKRKAARLMTKDAIKKLYELTNEIANKHLELAISHVKFN
ncbi:plant pleckstrin-like region protein [Medicago truncatula]|uniref:Plant pleckstrin-like region protein n=1 Tax=Medicago truncatula TaxID=3880 RepID=A0A072U389_MEDTR|nr:plant pleckstrin-like region protein [Medicago truncatula]